MKNNSTRTNSIFLAAVLVITLGLTSNASAQQPLLPNLTALPAFNISAGLNPGGKPELRFAFRSWNSGIGTLELYAGAVGRCRDAVSLGCNSITGRGERPADFYRAMSVRISLHGSDDFGASLLAHRAEV